MSLTVGIDFGTSNSGVGVYDGQKVHLLPVDPKSAMPEVVRTILYVNRAYKAYIGQEAVELYYRQNVNRMRRFVKKWVGEFEYRGSDMQYMQDFYVYVDELSPGRLLQYLKTALRSPGYTGTQIFERYYTLSEVITLYLQTLKQRAESILNETISGVRLGRPVMFYEDPLEDRKSEDTLRQAAMEAGFEQVEFEFEPVAAALYYEQSLERPQNTLIFDFGGGTLDITVIRLGDPNHRKVYANGGIGIAGSDFDRAIIQKRMLPQLGSGAVLANPDLLALVNAAADWAALPDLSTPQARLKLEQAVLEGKQPSRLRTLESLIFNDLAFSFYNAVEAGKIELSSMGATVIRLDGKDINLWELYTRYQFEKDIDAYRQQIEQVLLETIAASGLEAGEIEAVVKTGGSSRIPAFHEMLKGVFGEEKIRASDTFGSVTAGLAISSRR